MSHSRNKITTSIISIFKSNTKKPTCVSLDFSMKVILFFLLNQLNGVKAIIDSNSSYLQVDKLDFITKTWYRFQYPNDSSFFPFFYLINSMCPFNETSNPSDRNFFLTANPQCMWMNQPSGVGVNILVEEGKKLNSTILDCIEMVMQPICNVYNAEHHGNTNSNNSLSETIMLFTIPIILFIGIIILACYLPFQKRNTLIENNQPRLIQP